MGNASGSTISFAGTKTAVNLALATLTVEASEAQVVTLSATLWDPTKDFSCDTGHFYRVIDTAATYAQAKVNAVAAFDGNGYLVTLTSENENACVYDNIMSKADSNTANITWIGAMATYSAPTMTFTWDGGPENGTAFWSKAADATGTSGSSISSGYARWDVETIGGTDVYQPNAALLGGNVKEPCVVYYKAANNSPTWHDVVCTGTNQYVVEADSADVESASISIDFSDMMREETLAATGVNLSGIPAGIAIVSLGVVALVLNRRFNRSVSR